MDLKHTRLEYICVEYGDLEDLIKSTYGVEEFNLPLELESGNDVSQTFTVGKRKLENYELDDIEEFKETGHIGWNVHALMNDMCNRDIIEPGNYLVNICW